MDADYYAAVYNESDKTVFDEEILVCNILACATAKQIACTLIEDKELRDKVLDELKIRGVL